MSCFYYVLRLIESIIPCLPNIIINIGRLLFGVLNGPNETRDADTNAEPSVLASKFIDSATDVDAEPISNCCGAYADEGGDGCTEGICDCIMGAMS